MPENTGTLKRYNLVLPAEMFDEVQNVANKHSTTVVEILRRFIKLGLIAVQVEETPDAALLIKEGESIREIVFL